MSTSVVPKAKSAVQKAKEALENRIALVSDAARQQEKIVKLEEKLASEYEAYHAAYDAALAGWSKRELDDFDLRAPRRTATSAKPAAERATRRKNAARKTTDAGKAEANAQADT